MYNLYNFDGDSVSEGDSVGEPNIPRYTRIKYGANKINAQINWPLRKFLNKLKNSLPVKSKIDNLSNSSFTVVDSSPPKKKALAYLMWDCGSRQ